MLAIVQHEEQVTRVQRRHHCRKEGLPGNLAHGSHGRDRLVNERWLTHAGELDQPDSVNVGVDGIGRDLEGEACLAAAAGCR